MDKEILLDLANETARQYGDLQPDFPRKLVNRIQRKFKIKLDVTTVLDLVDHYKNIYNFSAEVLKDCLLPSEGDYAHPKDVDHKKYTSEITEQFPNDDKDILDIIKKWPMYHNYLR